jgi:hypothetical protein
MECSRVKSAKWAAKNLPYFAAWAARKRKADPIAARRAWRLSKLRSFGLTPEQYADLWRAQRGECACCGGVLVDGKFAHVDHCHQSGVVRGILCHACNVSIGLLKEDPSRARKLAVYMERWKLVAMAEAA